jgi:trans-2,3-dihydro-3-hydroxyanthranilate isomerase
MRAMTPFRHVDVFATAPYRGNGLIVVFVESLDLPAEKLRRVAEEMRQFETIFVSSTPGTTAVDARIFTVEEELPFAGHPVIGAAAALHERTAPDASRVDWQFTIDGRAIRVVSEIDSEYFAATMDQGRPQQLPALPEPVRAQAAESLGLDGPDLLALPLQVWSTGLPYLIVPVTPAGLSRARVRVNDLEPWLAQFGAKFLYVLDPVAQEGRTWDNAGAVEDVATGSAAGPAAAYLLENGLVAADRIQLAQGRFVGRPSSIAVTRDGDGHMWVGGPVRPVASGSLDALPDGSTTEIA